MSGVVLVTGASGNVGSEVVARLVGRGESVRAAVRKPSAGIGGVSGGVDCVRFDFEDPSTFAVAFDGVDRVFFVRPPQMADSSAFEPFIRAMREAGVKQVVFLSLMGVERNPVVPHHAIEKLIKASGAGWTMLRPSFYMQNLSTTHCADIRDRCEVFVPAGNGRTSFIDVRDIAEAAAVVLSEPGHIGCSYTLTGSEALTYGEVATILAEETGRPIRYSSPSGRAFAKRMTEDGHDRGFITVMRGIYLVARLRMASGITDDLERLIGRSPITFRQFAEDHRALFIPA